MSGPLGSKRRKPRSPRPAVRAKNVPYRVEVLEDRLLLNGDLSTVIDVDGIVVGGGKLYIDPGSLVVTEGQEPTTYSVSLGSAPQADVAVALHWDTELLVETEGGGDTLYFTPENWSVPQSVSVAAIDDVFAEGLHSSPISHDLSSSDPNYDSLEARVLDVSIRDNDTALLHVFSDDFDRADSGELSADIGILARDDLAERLGVDPEDVTITSVYADAPDIGDEYGSGPCPAIAMVPQHNIVELSYGTQAYRYVCAFGSNVVTLVNFEGRDWTTRGVPWFEQEGSVAVIDGKAIVQSQEAALVRAFDESLLPDWDESAAGLERIWGADIAVQADVNVGTEGHSEAGLVARHSGQDGSDMYVATLVGEDGVYSVQLWRRVAGQWLCLSESKVDTGTGTLRFTLAGTKLCVYFNDHCEASVTDTAISGPGTVGFQGTQGTTFDNFQIEQAPAELTLPYKDDFSIFRLRHDAFRGDYVIEDSKLKPAGTDSPGLAWLSGLTAADVALKARVALSETGHCHAGLVARYTGPGDANMYLGALVGWDGAYSLEIWRQSQGRWELLSSVPVSQGTGVLQFTVGGTTLQLAFIPEGLDPETGLPYAESTTTVSDSAITGPGAPGVRGTADTAFLNFQAEESIRSPAPVGDLTVISGRFVSAEDSALTASGASTSMALEPDLLLTNPQLSVQVRLADSGHSHVGLVARYQAAETESMYLGALVRREDELLAEIWRLLDGEWALLSSEPAEQSTGILYFEVIGNQQSLYLNDELLVTASDGAITGAGQYGIRGSTDTVFRTAPIVGQRLIAPAGQSATIDAGDFYYYGDEIKPLTRLSNTVIVGLEDGVDPEAVRDSLLARGAPLQWFSCESCSAYLKFTRPLGSASDLLEDILAELEGFAGVAWVSPMFMSETGHRCIAGNEIIVNLQDDIDPEDVFGDEIASYRRFVDNQYVVTLAEGGGLKALEFSQQLHEDPRTVWAEVNFFAEIRFGSQDAT